MTRFGYFLSSEEHSPRELVRQAMMAEEAGFDGLWISDHYHPWLDEQGHSPFVWSVIAALSQVSALPVTTAVTCPLVRIHPAIIAQAAATSAAMLETTDGRGRFVLGVGTGEALNEHIVDASWPPAIERMVMLDEAVEVIRKLFSGDLVTHRGDYYRVDTARLYTLPAEPPPIYMAVSGERAARIAARIADGLICTTPDGDLLRTFQRCGGLGKPAQGGLEVCWSSDPARARRTAHRLRRNEQLPGEAPQLLPLPRHIAQLSELVTEDMMGRALPCGDDPEEHAGALREFVAAGYDEVYVQQIGPEQEGFFEFYATDVLPRLREETPAVVTA